mmetsp:Transcript_12884/g.18402  ORF Transcript_12884/g.18402 Transcript_12884/m.18402 type:complete len:99 (-) Transcript_12884:739-1035(-)
MTLPEEEAIWNSESPYKCFYCRVDDHGYPTCPRMYAMKTKTNEAECHDTNANTQSNGDKGACRTRDTIDTATTTSLGDFIPIPYADNESNLDNVVTPS